MVLIEWKEAFELGIPAVDHEHRSLVDLINELHAGLEAEAGPVAIDTFLGEIYARISAHFALEEKVMRDIRYGRYAAHKADHEALLDDIRDIMDAHDRGDYAGYRELLAERLERWFSVHFRDHDALLHGFLLAGR